jgi:TonB family protein
MPLILAHTRVDLAMGAARLVLLAMTVACGGTLSNSPCPDGMFLRSSACWTLERPQPPWVSPEYSATDGQGEKVDAHGGPRERSVWAFVDGMHRRIHPQFLDTYLEALEGRPLTDPVNQGIVVATADIRVRADGGLDAVGISRPSRVPEFDRAVLDAIGKSAPFPAPPATIVHEGTTTVRWIFARPEVLACTAINVRILKP